MYSFGHVFIFIFYHVISSAVVNIMAEKQTSLYDGSLVLFMTLSKILKDNDNHKYKDFL